MWVFGYGSLLWNPGFEYQEQSVATLPGWHRSFCMRSIHHRGTTDDPGLVLALAARDGSHCQGLALSVASVDWKRTLDYLRERELISSAYLEKVLPIRLANGRYVDALTYVIDPGHVQYCNLDVEEQAKIIARAVGGRGPNTEYLHNTASRLEKLGIKDADLDRLSARVRELTII